MNFHTILLVTTISITYYPLVSSTGTFQFDFILYSNEKGRVIDGTVCDFFSSCDMYSKVEIHADDDVYSWDNSDKKFLSDNNVLVDILPYGYNVTFQIEPRNIKVIVYIYDYDQVGEDDLIDIVYIDYINNQVSGTRHDAHTHNEVSSIYLKYFAYYTECNKKSEMKSNIMRSNYSRHQFKIKYEQIKQQLKNEKDNDYSSLSDFLSSISIYIIIGAIIIFMLNFLAVIIIVKSLIKNKSTKSKNNDLNCSKGDENQCLLNCEGKTYSTFD
ncbi:hypothetical protein A3Q56_07459 [Intoshia linei]|uniref:GOLD domain-containing protein n=1 Tax=Intoshia linei TaxID=1819745 RepID=A0A177ASN4_9BILA|nr:hypothetical protein A3Q56_07459 [Intoshia linei]